MKLLYSAILLVSFIPGCNTEEKDPCFLEDYSKELIEKYPNFQSNELAQKAVNDSIKKFCQSYVGKEATLLDSVNFHFLRLIENEETGKYAALFQSTGLRTSIESSATGGKYVTADPVIAVLGMPDQKTAAKLSSGEEYLISGRVHSWDGDHQIHYPSTTMSTLDFGTVILDSISIKKIKKVE